jgi:hypothetical protein
MQMIHRRHSIVMPGLDPGIHGNRHGCASCVDGRVRPGHDDGVNVLRDEVGRWNTVADKTGNASSREDDASSSESIEDRGDRIAGPEQ